MFDGNIKLLNEDFLSSHFLYIDLSKQNYLEIAVI